MLGVEVGAVEAPTRPLPPEPLPPPPPPPPGGGGGGGGGEDTGTGTTDMPFTSALSMMLEKAATIDYQIVYPDGDPEP